MMTSGENQSGATPSPKGGEPQLHLTEPRLFTTGAVLGICLYGFVLFLPVLIAMLAVSAFPIGFHTFLIPLLAILPTLYFLPFGFGNLSVRRWVRSLHPNSAPGPDAFVVQLTFAPRIRSGFRAVVEDADDVGLLTFSSDELTFKGDSVSLRIPFERLTDVRPQNVGWRGLFVYGRRVAARVNGLPNVNSIQFAERSSWRLSDSKKTTQALYEKLRSVASAKKA